jgi:D-alanine-D-alanine ligase
MPEKTRVAILLGGDSSERAISIKTGCAVAGALSAARFDVARFDVAAGARDVSAVPEGVIAVTWRDLVGVLRDGHFDVVLPALHGGWGEDGTVQALLEVAALPYVGSPPRASVVAMDKAVAKAVLREAGLSVPRG